MATPNLNLPTVPGGQTNISTAYNESMQIIDAVNPLIFQAIHLTTPPTTTGADVGKRWVPATGATGAWAGHDNELAICTAADVWRFLPPVVGWRGQNLYDGIPYRWTGSAWTDDSAEGGIPDAPSDGTGYVRKDGAWVPETGGGGGGSAWGITFKPYDNEPPAASFATLDLRNNRPVLDFDTTTQEIAVFSGVLPYDYAGGGLTVTLYCALSSATTGTVGWDVAFERTQAGTDDIDSDSFASAQTVTAVTVPGTPGVTLTMSVNVSNGVAMDNLAAGEMFRLRIRRDVATDTATGDAELLSVHIREQ